jgi:hypothetical protein
MLNRMAVKAGRQTAFANVSSRSSCGFSVILKFREVALEG